MDPNIRQNIKDEKLMQEFNRELRTLKKLRKSLFPDPKINSKFKRGNCKECSKPLFQSGQDYCNGICFEIYYMKKKYAKHCKI